VLDTSNATLERIKTEKERQKKIAISLGYVPVEAAAKKPAKAPLPDGAAARKDHETEEEDETTVLKPDSPSSSSGARIDETNTGHKSGMSGMMAALHDVLNAR
jgi:hypothetical protein